MTVLATLLLLAAFTWLFRVSFTAVFDGDHLPAAVRARMDAVGPAAFAALLATKLAAVPVAAVLPSLAAVAAAGVVASRTRNHLYAVAAAVATFRVLTLV